MIFPDCDNMNEKHVCKIDKCTCGYTKGKCENMVCKDYIPIMYYTLNKEELDNLFSALIFARDMNGMEYDADFDESIIDTLINKFSETED